MAHERLRFPISTKELERRWNAVRAKMKEQEIDALVVQNDNGWLGGYFRYLTDIRCEWAYPKSCFFPVQGEMTVITSGGPPLPPQPPEFAVRGVKERISKPYFRTMHYTNTYDAGLMVDAIKNNGCKRVGLVGLGMMDAAFYRYVTENLPGVTFVEFTDTLDYIKAVKSEEELALSCKAARCQDIVCAAMPTIIRPGKYEYEIRGDIVRILEDLGSESQLIMIGSAPPGSSTGQYETFYQNRRVNPGDQVMVMVEVNGPGGFYGEIARTWVLGEPPKELLRCWDYAVKAQNMIASMLKPGAMPEDLLKANNEFMVEGGFQPEGRLFAHGQGYDLVERPSCVPGETMPLAENMFLAVHPIAFSNQAYAFACDNFIVTKEGGKRVHQTPSEILVIDI